MLPLDPAAVAWWMIIVIGVLAVAVIAFEVWTRTRSCKHAFDIHRIRRMADGTVRSRCVKCGVTAFAPYGLVLPGKLIRRK